MSDQNLFIKWVRATWAGWLLGIPLIIVLALAGEAVGIGGVQVIVGLGMGIGIGWMQGRVMRGILDKSGPWLLACAVGLAIPFLLTDISKFAGLDLPYFLPLAVALGGLTVGVWQAFLLRSRFRGTGSWVAASVLGWVLAGGTSAVADTLSRSQWLRGIWGALAFLGIVAFGGLILGLITGAALARMVRNQ
jgi:hypothetical protein